MIVNYKELNAAVNSACSQRDLLYLANLAEDLMVDMQITNKEHDEFMSVLQKKLEM